MSNIWIVTGLQSLQLHVSKTYAFEVWDSRDVVIKSSRVATSALQFFNLVIKVNRGQHRKHFFWLVHTVYIALSIRSITFQLGLYFHRTLSIRKQSMYTFQRSNAYNKSCVCQYRHMFLEQCKKINLFIKAHPLCSTPLKREQNIGLQRRAFHNTDKQSLNFTWCVCSFDGFGKW